MSSARPQFLVPVALCALALQALCCNVPVFRYALDHWHADAYQLELAARDAAHPEVSRFARNLGADSGLNLQIRRLDPEEKMGSRLLRPAMGSSEPAALWDGTVDPAAIARLTDSPARREIAARILKGHSAVWVLVEGSNPESTAAAASLLEKRLRYLEQVVRLPVIDPSDLDSKIGPGPALKVEFSILRLKHDAAEEEPLRAMLAGPRSGLERSADAWIAAVFGRGRVLGAWPAAEMDDAAIEEVALFLVGACSCQVKRQNPGWDILLQMDWDESLSQLGVPAPTETPTNLPENHASFSTGEKAAAESTPAKGGKPEEFTIRIPEPEKHEPKKRTGLPVPAILVGLTLVFLFAGKYRRSE